MTAVAAAADARPLAIVDLPLAAAGGDALAMLNTLLAEAAAALDADRDRARRSLAEAAALLASPQPPTAEPAGGLAPWQARKTIAFVRDHLERSMRVSELAAQVRLSRSYFGRAFKATFGQSPQDYIMARRLEQVEQMMLGTGESLCQIALACGFSDQAHMSRAFRRANGCAPNAWRRRRCGEHAPVVATA